jgi:hypothetical protein
MPGLWIHKWLGKFLANNSPVFPTAGIITGYHYRDHMLLGTVLMTLSSFTVALRDHFMYMKFQLGGLDFQAIWTPHHIALMMEGLWNIVIK